MDKETENQFIEMNDISNGYIEEVVKPLLPNVEPGPQFSFGTPQNIGKVTLAPKMVNGILAGSPYDCSKKELKFIHYTSLDSAKKIISSAKMRMFSLASMCDLEELKFALKNIIGNKSIFTIDSYKQEVFSLSMNEFQDEKEMQEMSLNYGDCGFGVGLVLTFPKEYQDNWRKHYLGKVLYGENNLKDLDDFHMRHKSFTDNLNGVNIEGQVKNFMLPLAGFHKMNGFEEEKEVRFLVVNKDTMLERHSTYLEFAEIEVNGEKRKAEADSTALDYNVYVTDTLKSYIEFELHPKHKVLNDKRSIPIPKIEKIILGPKLTETAKLKIELNKLAKENLGYEVKVEKSKLKL